MAQDNPFAEFLTPKEDENPFAEFLPAKKTKTLGDGVADFSGVTGGVVPPARTMNYADVTGGNMLTDIRNKFASSLLGSVAAPAIDILQPDVQAGEGLIEQNINALKKFGIGLEGARQDASDWLGKTFDTAPQTADGRARYDAIAAKERTDLAGFKQAAAARDIAENQKRIAAGLPTMEMENSELGVNKFADTLRNLSGEIDTKLVTTRQQNVDRSLGAALDQGVVPLAKFIASNPIDSAVSVLPSSAAFLAPAAAVGKASKLAGITDAGASLAGRASVGATATLSTADQSAQSILTAPEQELMQLAPYQALLAQGADPTQARAILAEQAYNATLPASAAVNTLAAGFSPGNVMEDLVSAGKLKALGATRLGSTAKGGLGEFAGEFGQGAGDQFSQNLGSVATGQLSAQDLGKNVAASGFLEGTAGGVPGAATGFLGANRTQVDPPNKPTVDPAGLDAAITGAPAATLGTSPPVTEATDGISQPQSTAPTQVEPTQDLDALLAQAGILPPQTLGATNDTGRLQQSNPNAEADSRIATNSEAQAGRGAAPDTQTQAANQQAWAVSRLTELETKSDAGPLSPDEANEYVQLLKQDRTAGKVGGRVMPGVKNSTAYTQAKDSGQLKPVQTFLDADNFKRINDELNHDAGDEAIAQIGQALFDELGEGNVFHRSGDEFIVQGDDPAVIEAAMTRARDRLSKAKLQVNLPDGTVIERTGIGFSYGSGKDITEAENAQRTDKENRAAAGLRTERRADSRRVDSGADQAPVAGRPQESESVGDVASAPVVETEPKPAGPVKQEIPKPESRTTSTKNAVTEAEREAAGRDPIEKSAPRSNEETLASAKAVLAENPNRGKELVEKLKGEGVQSISSQDEAVLLLEKTDLMNKRDALAKKASDQSGTEESRTVAKREWGDLESQINDIDQATYNAGSEWGRLGQFRQRMMREDFTLAALERKERVREGRPLTADETARLEAMAKKIAELTEQHEVTKKKLEEAEAKANVEVTYESLLKDMGQAIGRQAPRNVINIDAFKARADAARAKLDALDDVGNSKKKGQSGAVINPVAFVYLAEIGAYHVAKGANELAKFIVAMKQELGDKYDQYKDGIKEVFKASKLQAQTLKDEKAKKTKAPDPIDPENLTHKDVYDLARVKVQEGIRGEGPVMKAVHDDLVKIFPDLTERDVRRLFSEYGKAKFPSKDADKKELREIRALVQMQESIDRIEAGLDALKSGVQRDKATQLMREKRKELNALLKAQEKKTVASPEKLATYQQTRANNLRNQIEDLEKQIKTGQKPEKTPAPVPNMEVVKLIAERDALRKQLDEIEAASKPPVNEELKADERRKKLLEKQIADIEDQLKVGKKEQTGPVIRVPDKATAELMEKRDALRDQLNALSAKPKKTEEERYQQTRATSLARQLKALQERLANNDYERSTKPLPRDLNAANQQAAYELQKAKEDFLRHQLQSELSKRGAFGKLIGFIGQTFNLSRAIITSFDFSAVARQGGILSSAHPGLAKDAALEMFGAAISDVKAQAINDEIAKRDNARLYKQAGLELTDFGAPDAKKLEENFAARWIELLNKDPNDAGAVAAAKKIRNILTAPVRASGRAYIAYLNKMRADVFDLLIEDLKTGEKPTLEEAEHIAKYINIATGRGSIGSIKDFGAVANLVFFAPRLLVSRFQYLMAFPSLMGGTNRTKQLIIKEYARTMRGTLAIIGLGYLAYLMAGDDDEEKPPFMIFDPRSADAFKMRFGDTRLDPLYGLQQASVFMSRIASGETKSLKGKVMPIREQYRISDIYTDPLEREYPKFGAKTGEGVIGGFMRQKLAPITGAAVNLAAGTDMLGQEVTPLSAAQGLVTPISLGNVSELMEAHGVPAGSALFGLNLLGMGVQHHGALQSADRETGLTEFDRRIKEVNEIQTQVEDRISALPKDQWAGELDKLKKEYPEILAGVELDTYKDVTANRNKGRAGEPKATKDGKVKLLLSGDASGSVLGELEGYRYYDPYEKKEKTSEGIIDRVRTVNKSINAIEGDKELTPEKLLAYTSWIDSESQTLAALGKEIDANPKAAKRRVKQAEIEAVIEDLKKVRLEEKRKAIGVIQKGVSVSRAAP